MMRTRGLGRGLGALIPGPSSGVEEVDIDLIVPNPHQPRSEISEASVRDLAESIREHGVLQPLVVSEADGGVYQLIAGERRLRAARLAGLTKVPVMLKEAADRGLLEIALVENLQREDLNALEEAQAYRRLADEFGLTQEEIATRVGRSRAAVANAMRLLALGPEVKSALASGAISEGHARALLALEDEAARLAVLERIVSGGLSVRETERLVRGWGAGAPRSAPKAAPAIDHEAEAVEARLREALGTKVELRRAAGGRGTILLHYYSDEELNGLLERLGVPLG